ncbi:hypothetical protein BDV93DRAFT_555972 [Ceratobasidium sp. AG-I]|nr:hypothetical protein BDV93DRAFT_555972 [Ceratobasidium sp. AG-I]
MSPTTPPRTRSLASSTSSTPSSEPSAGHLTHVCRPTTSPQSSVRAASNPASPSREVYQSRGLLDPNYVFSKPPRPHKLRRANPKYGLITPRHPPLSQLAVKARQAPSRTQTLPSQVSSFVQ